MTDAKTLLLELLAVIPNGDKVAPLFAEDGVVELPFLHAVGMPTRYQGRTQIKEFLRPGGRAVCGFRIQTGGHEGSDRDARPGLCRIHDAREGCRHWASYPSSVRGATCCGTGTNQAAAGVDERRRRGASAEPERN